MQSVRSRRTPVIVGVVVAVLLLGAGFVFSRVLNQGSESPASPAVTSSAPKASNSDELAGNVPTTVGPLTLLLPTTWEVVDNHDNSWTVDRKDGKCEKVCPSFTVYGSEFFAAGLDWKTMDLPQCTGAPESSSGGPIRLKNDRFKLGDQSVKYYEAELCQSNSSHTGTMRFWDVPDKHVLVATTTSSATMPNLDLILTHAKWTS